ncbi:uncharacterized protein [Battus philenor]|uniref:uncharacterized protein n=1 Tax=Battus philenor TaxID=42288 RepID=UPI0035CF6EC5
MKKSLDKLSEDILDEDFVNIFRPMHFIQYIIGALQVKIQYGYITTSSYGYNVFSIFIWLTNILSMFVFVAHCESSANSMLTDFYLKLSHVLNGLILLIISIRSSNKGNLNSEIYVKLQKIDRDLNMKNIMKINKKAYIFSTTFVSVTVLLGVIWSIILNLYIVEDFCPVAFIVQLPVLGTYMDMSLIFFKLYFIVIRCNHINTVLKETLRKRSSGFENDKGPLFVSIENNDVDNKLWSCLIITMEDIITVLEDLINIYQFTIFSITCEFMLLNMVLVQSVITTLKQQIPINIYSITSIVPVITFLFFILLLCIIAEILKSKMEDSRKLCTTILYQSKGPTRDNAKRLLLILNVNNKISIYGIFGLGIQLPFNLFAITATYTIVLLQFALL